jgi:hypothetical protein
MSRLLEYLELVEDSEATIYNQVAAQAGMTGPYYMVTIPHPAPSNPEDKYMVYAVGNFNAEIDRLSQVEDILGTDGEFLLRRMRAHEITSVTDQTHGPESKIGGLVFRRYMADEEQRIRQVATQALCEVSTIC